MWQIGASDVAPKFNAICKPNEWTKGTGGGSGPTTGNATRLEFWREFRAYALEREPKLKPRKATSKARLVFSTGRKGISLHARVVQRKGGMLGVSLSIRGKNSKSYFEILKTQQQEIEKALDVPVNWIESHGQGIYQVRTHTSGRIEDRDQWPQHREWLLNTLLHFQEVFADRIAKLPSMPRGESDEGYGDEEDEA